MKNDNPIFALLPPEVLAKAKALAEENHREDLLKDLVGRRLFPLALATVALLMINAANAWVFATVAAGLSQNAPAWMVTSVWIYAAAILVGGIAAMFNALVAWLEVAALRGANPSFEAWSENLRLYRRSTWLPLIPLSLLPALFNAWFSLGFLVAAISLLFASLLLLSFFSKV